MTGLFYLAISRCRISNRRKSNLLERVGRSMESNGGFVLWLRTNLRVNSHISMRPTGTTRTRLPERTWCFSTRETKKDLRNGQEVLSGLLLFFLTMRI